MEGSGAVGGVGSGRHHKESWQEVELSGPKACSAFSRDCHPGWAILGLSKRAETSEQLVTSSFPLFLRIGRRTPALGSPPLPPHSHATWEVPCPHLIGHCQCPS